MFETIENLDFLDKKAIDFFQVEQMKKMLLYLNEKSTFYQAKFKEWNFNPKDFTELKQLEQLPFTTKEDLSAYNDDFLCISKNKVADFVTTSGTIADPVTFYLSHQDIERLAYNEAQSLRCTGASHQDVFQLMTTIDKRFMAGLAYWQGALKLKAGIVRVGPGAPHLQWDSIHRFQPTYLIAIPSFIPKLIDFAIKNNIDYKNSSVKAIVCIGEPIRNKDLALSKLGEKIQSLWNVKLYSTYASTEMGAAFTECEHQKGGHLRPELLYVEVVDEKGKAVANGEKGEVVVSTLGVEGMPLLRYKTGDICTIYNTKCTCGRNSLRLGPVLGRKKQMLKYKGTTIFPPAIFDVLDVVEDIAMYQLEIEHDEFKNDKISIVLDEKLCEKPNFEKQLKSLFRSKLRVVPYLKFVKKQKLEQALHSPERRKPLKIIDKRK